MKNFHSHYLQFTNVHSWYTHRNHYRQPKQGQNVDEIQNFTDQNLMK